MHCVDTADIIYTTNYPICSLKKSEYGMFEVFLYKFELFQLMKGEKHMPSR